MAKDEANDENEEEEGGGSKAGLVPLILGALSVLLNIAILVYLILFPAGGGAEMDEMVLQVKAIHDEVLPGMGEQLAAVAGEIVPGGDEEGDEEDDEGGDEDEEEYDEDEDDVGDEEGDEEEYESDGGDLSEITMMLTDTQLILRQMAENINNDTASIKRSVGGAATAGKQIRNMRQDLKRIEKKLNELLGDGPKKKRRSGTSQFPEVEDGRISYP